MMVLILQFTINQNISHRLFFRIIVQLKDFNNIPKVSLYD